MVGIILAGGSGTRLHPSTLIISKQLLPVYDKPMIYYPLSVLMLAHIKKVVIISTPKDISRFRELFGNGEWLGMDISYLTQDKPRGLAHGIILARDIIGDDSVCLILGDNIFYGQKFSPMLQDAQEYAKKNMATIFAYRVKDPHRFGIVEIDKEGNAISIEEKPTKPKSNFAVTGLYFYDNSVVDFAHSIQPSKRGELEITDVNRLYLAGNRLKTTLLSRGFAWLDTGTPDSLNEASSFVQTIELRQGAKIACLEEIAFYNEWISKDMVLQRAKELEKSEYGIYLKSIIES